MNDRDHFAAAALTGLIAHGFCADPVSEAAPIAYAMADAMLSARGTTDHDAAPAATASDTENQAVGRRAETSAGEAGTGDTRAAQEPVAWGVYRGDDIAKVAITQKVAAWWESTCPERGYRVVPLYAAPPAAGVTLTDAEREAVWECADIARSQLLSAREGGDEETFGRWIWRHALLRGLLARAAKEEAQ